jgi:hypothetical protein
METTMPADPTPTLDDMIEAVRIEIMILEAKVSTGPQHLAALRAALRELEARRWRPIETAPKDGEWVLTCIAGTLLPFVAAFDDEPGDPRWFSLNRAYETGSSKQPYQPTHWAPLLSLPPAPPATSDGGEE